MQSGKIYGYARVSSKHQNEERQLIALRAFGIRDRDIYCDRQSGKDFDRPNYQRLLLRLQAGDVFVVKRTVWDETTTKFCTSGVS